MTDYSLVKKFLDKRECPKVSCPYLRGYYCLTDGSGCLGEVVSGEVYACESSVYKTHYKRMLSEVVDEEE